MLTKLGSLTQQDVLVPLVMLLLICVTINSNICQKAPESTSIIKIQSNTKDHINTIKFDEYYYSIPIIEGLSHFLNFSISKCTILHSNTLCHTFVDKVQNIIF